MSALEDFTAKFTTEKVPDVIQIKRNFFQVSEPVLQMKRKIPVEPFSAGLFLGVGNPLHPSAALLDWLGERTERIAILDRKSAWLFLCGRDIFAESIVSSTVHEGLAIVKNDLGEVLGYGAFVKNKKIPLKNIFDKGDFIRREKH